MMETNIDQKGKCLHMLADLYFNRNKITFEEFRNLLAMIHSLDSDNLVVAEEILKVKAKNEIQSTCTPRDLNDPQLQNTS